MIGFGRRGRNRTGAEPLVWRLSDGAPPAESFVAVVPGQDVPLLALDLPPGLKGGTRERVAHRQLADLFGAAGSEGMEMRPAALGRGKAPWDRVLVVDPAMRAAWAGEVAGTACSAVLPDYLTLPAAPDVWTVEAAGGQVRVRLGPADGFTAEPDLALELLAVARTEAPPRAVLRLGAAEERLDRYLVETGLPVHDGIGALAAETGTRPGVLAHGEAALDLARDPGAELMELRAALRPWRLPAAMAVLGLALWSVAVVTETRALRDQALAHRRSAEDILRRTMIPNGPILDMRAQVAQRLEAQRAAGTRREIEEQPLDVLRDAGWVMTESGALVQSAGYRPGSGLLVELRVADFAALDALVLRLREGGIALDVAQSAARENEGVEATLTLAAGSDG